MMLSGWVDPHSERSVKLRTSFTSHAYMLNTNREPRLLSQPRHNYGEVTFWQKLRHWSGFEMSLRAKSHTDLQAAGKSSLEDSLYNSFSMSSSNVNRGSRFGNGTAEEVKGLSRPSRRPVRVVRPVSAISPSGSFLQINHLQGELVRKRKVRR